MKMNKLFTLAVTMLLSTVTVVSCGNKTSSSQAISSEATKTSEYSSQKDSSTSSSSASSSSEEVINYGTKDAPISALAAVAIMTAAKNDTFVDTPFYIQAYVIAVEDGKYYIADKKDDTDKSFVIENATVATGVNTPVVGSKITVTGYGKRYHNADETGMIYTLTTNGTTSPSIIYSDAAAAVNYGTKDAPLTIAEAKMLCDAAGDNTVSTTPLFVKGYVKEITYNSTYSNYEIWISSTSTGEKEFEIYACTIADGVVTPIEGSQIIATGYYEKYVGSSSTTYELTHTKIDGTRVYPSVVWSDAVEQTIPDAPVIGSLESPKTVAEAYTVIEGLTASTYKESYYSTDKYYVKGIVKSVTLKNDTYVLDIADTASSTDTLNVYCASLATGVTAPKIGDEVIAIGHLTNYVGKYEMAGDGKTCVTPIIEKVTTGTATYAIETSIVDSADATSTNATISGLPTEAVLANTELSFQVTAATGYRVSSVSFNGTTLVADAEGNYNATSYLENKIIVTVVEDVTYEETTATYSISEIATANNWTNGTQYSTLPTGNDVLSITASKGSNTGKYYTKGNEWRFYQGESAKLTISVSGSHVIKSVTITYNTDKSGIAIYNDTQIQSGTTITAGSSVSKMEISVGNTGTATNGQVKITNIVVVYA